MRDIVSPAKIAAALTEHWSPRVVAELDDSYVMLIERKTTLHTGGEITDKTRSLAEQLRPV